MRMILSQGSRNMTHSHKYTHTHKIGKKVARKFLFDAGENFEKELDNAESVQLGLDSQYFPC